MPPKAKKSKKELEEEKSKFTSPLTILVVLKEPDNNNFQ
jgi:hypothetical protein